MSSSVIKVLVLSVLLPGCVSHLRAQAMAPMQKPADLSTTLTLTVNGRSIQLSLAELAALPQTSVKVHNEHTKREETYTGVAMIDLLPRAGLALNPETEQLRYHSYVRAQGTDRYFVLYSVSEMDPAHHNAQAIVATHVDGHDLGQDGRLKLVSTADTKPARWVRNLTSLTLTTVN